MFVRSVRTEGSARTRLWVDLVVVSGLCALLYGLAQVASQWHRPLRHEVDIDLSPWALPKYAFFSLARGWIAYAFSLLFTVVVGSWAYYDARARRFVLVALDILQSLPVTTFLVVVELALISLFPSNNVGLELVCVFAIFTGQVWNMVFSYYDSLRGLPPDFRMLAKLYNFDWWQRFWRVELPFSAQGLLYNSMVSMAGGWFFLTITEAFTLRDQNFRLPGIGSYMRVAVDHHDGAAQFYGIVAMSVVIVATDRLIWWPLIVWARRFKLDDFGAGTARKSALQLWLARSAALERMAGVWHRIKARFLPPPTPPCAATSLAPSDQAPPPPTGRGARLAYLAGMAVLLGLIAWGALRLVGLLITVKPVEWRHIFIDALYSFGRVMAAVAIGTVWTVPFGVWIGLNPKVSSRLQPFIQFAASFPSPMIYPWLFALVVLVGGTLQWGSILLILFGTQWYILFNVAGAAAAIPHDILSCAALLRLSRWTRWRKFLIPAILPGLVTGWITAAGGAWNATVVSEILTVHDHTFEARGLGAYISHAGDTENYARLTAAALVMTIIVVGVNRTVWKRIQTVANERCRFIT
jgi:NitT/TauT family transport system permease protein